ncbi:polysaccharide pyruvyl transferase family protein [Microbacterium sp. R86528]|uniref:polysaccharide pyruvyl transferase family protein n=1 Tax=Microbacterium sp. R86528 TaxID=3093864 RepID=UPI0037C67DE5
MNSTDDTTTVAIVNFHFAHNHGAVLQALALQDRLQALGCSVRTIDYRPRGHAQQYAVFPDPIASGWWKYRGSRATGHGIVSSAKRALSRGLRSILQWRDHEARRTRDDLFTRYVTEHLPLTRRYTSLRALRSDPPAADLYVSGSDQIWNPGNTGGVDPVYFLAFGRSDTYRASYAASPCELDVALHRQHLENLTRNMDSVSLRESDLKAEIGVISQKPIDIVADPVLLMTADDFSRYRSQIDRPQRPYIVIYAVRTKATIPVVARLVQGLLLKQSYVVIDLSLDPSQWPFPVTRPSNLSPGAFISYIAESSFVVSNSFHATVFSLLFEREFAVATEPETAQRLNELLTQTGLLERAFMPDSVGYAQLEPLRYEMVRDKIEAMRSSGLEYLNDIVGASRQPRIGE